MKAKPVVADKPIEGNWDTTWIKAGESLAWVEMPAEKNYQEVFIESRIVKWDENAKKADMEYGPLNKGPAVVRIDKFVQRTGVFNSIDDLVDIECLNDAELLYYLKMKFFELSIFTYCGPTLLIMNPYEKCDKFYEQEILKTYMKCALSDMFQLKDKPPHVWAISALTYWQIFANNRKQAICISGESGAGKTVNAKSAMQFLTFLSSNDNDESAGPDEERIEDKILGCNPILEAFGNSKTVRNDNSSRFGKYVALICKIGKTKSDCKIRGAATTNYLLEKSRIINQAPKERNYHIFYQCMYGLPTETLKKYNFENNPEKYEILKKTKVYKVNTVDDIKEFSGVTNSFKKLKFSEEEVDIVYSVVGGVLNMGNVVFDDSEYDGTKFTKIAKNDTFLPLVSENLGLDKETLSKALTRELFTIMGKTSEKAIDKGGCNNLRDALCKDLFEKLFNWLVKRLNVSIVPPEDRGIDVSQKKDRLTIGLLDIFGFEIFEVNSLEQFCINFTNENLHQLYIQYVFKAEQKIFTEEGLEELAKKNLNFTDNTPVIEMLSKGNKSVISLLNESTRTAGPEPAKNDEKFYGNIKNFLKDNKLFKIPRIKPNSFTIIHTAREVDYFVPNFISKNQDSLSSLLLECIMKSQKRQLVRVFKNILNDEETPEEDSGEDKNKKFLAYKFNQQMYDLMDELTNCECNFIRCLKPNEDKEPKKWDPVLSIGQIRYLGILDSIKIRKTSYPQRKDFKAFYKRYIDLDPVGSRLPFKKHEDNPDTNWKQLCMNVHKAAISQHGEAQILFGNTKVFMRMECYLDLENIFQEKLKKKKASILGLEQYIRFFKYKQMFLSVTFKTISLTVILRKLIVDWKSKILYRHFRLMRNFVKRLQRRWRFKSYLRDKRKMRQAAKIIKSTLETQTQMGLKQKKVNACRLINRVWRGALARKEKRRLLMFKIILYETFDDVWLIILERIRQAAALKIQAWYRGTKVRQQNKAKVEQIKTAKADFIRNKAATKIQAMARGRIARMRYLQIIAATKYIQGFFLMQWMTAMFRKLRKSTVKIQIAMRRYLLRKHVMDMRIKRYMEEEGNTLYDLQDMEYSCIVSFAGGSRTKGMTMDPAYAKHAGFELSAIPDSKYYNTQKFYLWMLVLDIEYTVDLNEVYDPIWAEQFKALCVDSQKVASELQVVEVGALHTLCASNTNKMYSWGCNDYGQLARDLPKNGESFTVNIVPMQRRGSVIPRVKNIACGDDHSLFVCKEGELYVSGRNDRGQLGMPGTPDINYFQLHPLLNKVDVFTNVAAKGSHSVAVGESGNAYYFPMKISPIEILNEPIRLNFPEDVKIMVASCGYDYVMLLSTKGLLFSMGKNIEGQLGHGNFDECPKPKLVEYLWHEKQKITTISCGMRHSICRATNGKIYTWGWGDRGQLGHGNNLSYSEPRLVRFPSNIVHNRVLQARASYRSCLALMEDLTIYWWGTNGFLQQETLPIKLQRNEIFDQNMSPVRIMTTWSKGMNVTYCTIADSRKVEIMKSNKLNILNNLANTWETCYKDIDPPIPDSIAKYFASKNIGSSTTTLAPEKREDKQRVLISKLKNSGLIQSQAEILSMAAKLDNAINSSRKGIKKGANMSAADSQLKAKGINISHFGGQPNEKAMRAQMDESVSKFSISHKSHTPVFAAPKQAPGKSPIRVKEGIVRETEEKSTDAMLREIKYRLDLIQRKPPSRWTKEEAEFYKAATEKMMMALLAKTH